MLRLGQACEVLQATHVIPRIVVGKHLGNVAGSAATGIVSFNPYIPSSCLPQSSHIFSSRRVLILKQGMVVQGNLWAGIT